MSTGAGQERRDEPAENGEDDDGRDDVEEAPTAPVAAAAPRRQHQALVGIAAEPLTVSGSCRAGVVIII